MAQELQQENLIYVCSESQFPSPEKIKEYFSSLQLSVEFKHCTTEGGKRYTIMEARDPFTFTFLTTSKNKFQIENQCTITTGLYYEGVIQELKENDTKVFVANLPKSVKRKDLKDFFSNFGEVKRVILRNRNLDTTYSVIQFREEYNPEGLIDRDSMNFMEHKIIVVPYVSQLEEDYEEIFQQAFEPEFYTEEEFFRAPWRRRDSEKKYFDAGNLTFSELQEVRLFYKSFQRRTQDFNSENLVDYLVVKHRFEGAENFRFNHAY